MADGGPEVLLGACGGLFEEGLELGEGHLDGVEVGAVGGQVKQLGACGLDGCPDPGELVGRQVVHDDDVARRQGRHPYAPPIRIPLRGPGSAPDPRDPFPGHDIDEIGAAEHDRYAQSLVNDSDPSKTAGYLKNVTEWYGDRGRGDVADLLGRFHKVDPDKARHLQDEVFRQTGQRIPFRVAPVRPNTGGPMADLEQDSDSVQLPKANPWGSAEAADRWEAGNMAKVLLGRTDYKDAVKHFAGEFKRDPGIAKPYTAAVFEEMAKDSPKQAVQFVSQMKAAGLVEEKKRAQTEDPESQLLNGPERDQGKEGIDWGKLGATAKDVAKELIGIKSAGAAEAPKAAPAPTSTPTSAPAPAQKPPVQPAPTPAPVPKPNPEPTPPPSGSETDGYDAWPPQSSTSNTEKQSGGKDDDKDQVEWTQDKGFHDSGSHSVRVNGPVRVDLKSITAGVDGLRYHVQWFPLDEKGNIETHIRNEGMGPAYGGHVMPGRPWPQVFKPPYENPHGWEVKVTVPPQPGYNDNSSKPWLDIMVPSGSRRKK